MHSQMNVAAYATSKTAVNTPMTALYLASDRAGFMTGQPVRIDVGLGLSLAGSRKS